MQPWVNAGLAVEAENPGLIFQLEWGSKQFNAFLRSLFPILFAHFDSISTGFKSVPDEPDATGMRKIEYSLPYVLLQKMRKNYYLVDDTHPVATTYKTYLSGDMAGAGFRAKSLFLGAYLCHMAHIQNYNNLTPPQSHKGTNPPRGLRRLVCSIPCSRSPHYPHHTT